MAITCQDTRTISYSNQLICNHLIKIYDIEPMFGTISVIVNDFEVIPGIGTVSKVMDNYRLNIKLISKNVGAGTAVVQVSTETIEAPPDVKAIHYLDLYVKPYSWYSIGGAAGLIVTKLNDIGGAIANIFSGISGWQYLGTEVITLPEYPNNVIIRAHLREMGIVGMDGVNSMAAPAISLAPIIIAVAVILLFIGLIVGFRLWQITGQLVSKKEYSKQEVVGIVYDKVVPAQMSECEKNYTDPISIAQCKKSIICGAANGVTDGLGLSDTDCATLGINEKIDTCTQAYNIDKDLAKYKSCIDNVAKSAGTETKNKTPKEGADWTGILLLGGIVLVGMSIMGKGERTAERIIIAEGRR